ncbi:MAG: alpha-L-rhamnosidase C-terminal domain-containing protein, partial [Chitinophagaceae bacterium]
MILFLYLLTFVNVSQAQIKEPYKPLHGGNYSGPMVKESPDPLVAYRWYDLKPADSLQVYALSPEEVTCIPRSSFKRNGNTITVLGKGNILFDFGRESAGWLEFDSNDLTDSVEASISEYNEPEIVSAGVKHRFKTAIPVKYGTTYRLKLNSELYEGVRFAWIHVRTFSKPWHIKNVKLICQIKPTNYLGQFSCNDPELTRIWYTGAYTVKLNLLQNYFGAILIDRGDRYSWTGDDYPAEAASLAAFGNYGMVKKTLAYTADNSNGIPAYSLYWVLSLVDYFNYTGDTSFLKKYIGTADTILTKAYYKYDHLPPLGFMGWSERLGAGFDNPQIPEAENTYRMLCIDAWRQFARSMSFLGRNRLAKRYDQFAKGKTKLLKGNEKMMHHFGIYAVSEAIDAGLGNIPEITKRSSVLFANRLRRLSLSPFNQYFIIQAMASAKQYVTALSTIGDCWGGQIKYGGTTFFEVYRPSWNAILKPNDPPPNGEWGYTSLAHPWGCGVTQWLSENILGIKPVMPGFRTFAIIPHLAGNLTWVKGSMPTPHGIIIASFNTQSGKCFIHVPEGTSAEKIALPKSGRRILRITLNGRLLRNTSFHRVSGAGNIIEDKEYVYL